MRSILQPAIVFLIITMACRALGAASETTGVTSAAKTPVQYPTIDEIIQANTDILGEASLRQQDGPNYDFFAQAMPPLRYVNAPFRHYPIVLAAPRNACKARLVSNGSAINAAGGGEPWTDVGIPVHFYVGAEQVPFGNDLANLDGPQLADGYLPVYTFRYRVENTTYHEETFLSTDPALTDHGVVFVRFTVEPGQTGIVRACVETTDSLQSTGDRLCNGREQMLLWIGPNWRWNPEKHAMEASISSSEEAVLAIFTVPVPTPAAPTALSTDVYHSQRNQCLATWRELLGKGSHLEVPEPVVNNAMRTVLGANFSIVTDSTVNYSAGNTYLHEYITEGSRTVGAFLLFGFIDEARPMLLSLLDHAIPDHKYAVTGWKLRALAQYYWLTRGTEFLLANRAHWEPLISLLLDDLDAETGLLPKDYYATDIAQPVWNLKTNATSWRGLRDTCAVLREMGEPNPQLEERVRVYRQAILDAADKSIRRDFDPPFVPNTLLDSIEAPYASLTESCVGSYWCLVSNAVLDSGLFNTQPEKAQWILDTLHRRGGVCMGMLRFDQHSGLFANERGIDDNYTVGYTLHLLQQDDPDRALVSFYGKLAQGFTRDAFVGGEGTSLDPLDANGRPMYLPPCTAGNAFFLWTLRNLLVQDWDTDDNGVPDTLRLLYAVPRAWLRDRAAIKFKDAPTAFGKVSIETESRLTEGFFLVRLSLPLHRPAKTLLRARVPEGWDAVSATVDAGAPLPVDPSGVVDLSQYAGDITVRFTVSQAME